LTPSQAIARARLAEKGLRKNAKAWEKKETCLVASLLFNKNLWDSSVRTRLVDRQKRRASKNSAVIDPWNLDCYRVFLTFDGI